MLIVNRNNLALFVASLGKRPTAAQKRDLIGKRDNLQKRITKFEKSMLSFIRKHDAGDSDDDEDTFSNVSSESSDNRDEDDMTDILDSGDEDEMWDEEDIDDDAHLSSTIVVENMRLSLPSNLKRGGLGHEIFTSLRNQEATLREGQINESLRKLRMALGEKAWMLRNNVRDASGGKGKLRAWSGVKQKTKEVGKHLKLYRQATSALRRMGLGEKWKPITKNDLKMSGDMTEANRTGQRAHTLAWFWRLEDGAAVGEMEDSGPMSECMSNFMINGYKSDISFSLQSELATCKGEGGTMD
jgi:hypothetical protein